MALAKGQRVRRPGAAGPVGGGESQRAIRAEPHPLQRIFGLQQVLGNQAVQQRASTCPALSLCPTGGACHVCPFHARAMLAVTGKSGPMSEQSAALQAAAPAPVTATLKASPLVQRQRSPLSSGASGLAPEIVHTALRGSSRGLDDGTRGFFESRFGHDFGQVRVHTDSLAADSATAVQAAAYTVGNHIVFGAGRYSPDSPWGERLLAHELAHVRQQSGRAGSALQSHLEVGAAADPAEVEADRIAAAILSGLPMSVPACTPTTGGPPTVRRAPEGPQTFGQTRHARIPVPERGEGAHVHVIRHLETCPCRKVADAGEWIFYNPDLNSLAIAYRHCRGGRTIDIYGTLESNATAFLGRAAPVGTATVGIDVNIVGRKVGGRAIIEAVGSNVTGGEGVGGRARIVFQGGQWRVFVTADYLRRLGASSGDLLNLSLGTRLGPVTAEFIASDVLSPTPSLRGTGCVNLGFGVNPCLIIERPGETHDLRMLLGLNIPFGGPETRKEDCNQCLCPPAGRRYECYLDVPPRDVTTEREVEVERTQEFRYYFRLDQTTPSEDRGLVAQSEANLSTLASQVAAGGSVSYIIGYASPEATERHNQNLSQNRAIRMRDLIRGRVGPDAPLPEPGGAGELLGRRPAPSPSSLLGDIITEHGFRSAEDLSALLPGKEIPYPELAEQFISLFEALKERRDRLAVFGLSEADAIAAQTLDAVEAFLRSRGRGPRPWEQVFRRLRYAVARVVRRERKTVTETERTRGSLETLPKSQCDDYARQAEARKDFGPIAPEALKPRTTPEERDRDCRHEPQREDRDKGCDYALPPSFRRPASAPWMAPRRLP